MTMQLEPLDDNIHHMTCMTTPTACGHEVVEDCQQQPSRAVVLLLCYGQFTHPTYACTQSACHNTGARLTNVVVPPIRWVDEPLIKPKV